MNQRLLMLTLTYTNTLMRPEWPKPDHKLVRSVLILKNLKTMERTKFKTLEQLYSRIIQAMHADYRFKSKTFNPARDGWIFKYDNAIRRLGCCSYRNHTISLSKKMCEQNLENWHAIHDILLHEISHAFNYYIHGYNCDNHGPKFKAIAAVLGCEASAAVKRSDSKLNFDMQGKYTYACRNCGAQHDRNRRIKKMITCGVCDTVFNPKNELILISQNF